MTQKLENLGPRAQIFARESPLTDRTRVSLIPKVSTLWVIPVVIAIYQNTVGADGSW